MRTRMFQAGAKAVVREGTRRVEVAMRTRVLMGAGARLSPPPPAWTRPTEEQRRLRGSLALPERASIPRTRTMFDAMESPPGHHDEQARF